MKIKVCKQKTSFTKIVVLNKINAFQQTKNRMNWMFFDKENRL